MWWVHKKPRAIIIWRLSKIEDAGFIEDIDDNEDNDLTGDEPNNVDNEPTDIIDDESG